MNTRVTVKMKPVNAIVTRLGVGKRGDVQRFVTHEVNRRIGRYMPHLTGALETKLKRVTGDAEITVFGPYARYQYYGKVMVGRPPKTLTHRDLRYTKTFNPLAGPLWDKRMMADEGGQIAADIQKYIDRRAGRG